MMRRCFGAMAMLVTVIPLACGEDGIHASLVQTPTAAEISETPATILELDGMNFGYRLVLDEPWVQADTFLAMKIRDQQGEAVTVRLAHFDGPLVVDGKTFPEDSWLYIDGQILSKQRRLYAYGEDFGHSLTLDADILGSIEDPESGLTIDGYFTVDGVASVWVQLAWEPR